MNRSMVSCLALLVGEHVVAVLHEERVVVTLVGVLGVVLGRRSGTVGKMLFGVDRSDRTYVGLIARGAGCSLFEVHVQHAVAEDRDRVRVRDMRRFDDSTARLLL